MLLAENGVRYPHRCLAKCEAALVRVQHCNGRPGQSANSITDRPMGP